MYTAWGGSAGLLHATPGATSRTARIQLCPNTLSLV